MPHVARWVGAPMSSSSMLVVDDSRSFSLSDALHAADSFDPDADFDGEPVQGEAVSFVRAGAPEPDRRWRGSVARAPLAFVMGLALAAFAAPVVMETPARQLARTTAERTVAWAGQVTDLHMSLSAAAQAAWQGANEAAAQRTEPLRITLESVSTPPRNSSPRLAMGGTIEGPLATMLRVPLEITNAENLDQASVVLVSNVP